MEKANNSTQSSDSTFGGSHRTASRQKKIILFVVFPVVILLIAGGAIWYVTAHVKKEAVTKTETATAKVAVETKAQGAKYDEAVAASKTGGEAAGQAVLDKALQSATTNESKSVIYAQKSSLASSSVVGSNYATAIEYAKQADQLDPTNESAAVLAALEQAAGSKSDAISYYQTALKRIGDRDSADLMDQSSFDYYTSQIKGLQDAA